MGQYKNILVVAIVGMIALSKFCFAQSPYTAEAAFRVRNCELLPFFDKEYNIDSIEIDYIAQRPERLIISRTSDAGHIREVYLMSFSGDRYLLNSRYEKLTVPTLLYSALNLQKDGEPIAFGNNYCKTKAIFTKEFVDYQLFVSNGIGSETDATMNQNPHRAQYAAGLKQLEINLLAYLEQKLGNDALKSEGAFLLRGMVDKDKNMKNVQVISSEDAKIGETLKKWLERPVGAWIPELQGGGAVKSYIDVFIRFKNTQLEVETCKSTRDRNMQIK